MTIPGIARGYQSPHGKERDRAPGVLKSPGSCGLTILNLLREGCLPKLTGGLGERALPQLPME